MKVAIFFRFQDKTMPQSMNKRVRLDMRLAAPVHKDSIRGNIFDLSVETRKRALRMNEGQYSKLQMKTKVLDKNQRERNIKESKRIEKIDKSVKQLCIYRQVLRNFHYDNLVSVNKKARENPRTTTSAKKRLSDEIKILHSGFSVDILKTQMDVLSKEQDKKRIRLDKLHQEYIISKARSDIALSREGTFSALIRDYKNRCMESPPPFQKCIQPTRKKTETGVLKLPKIKL